MSPILRDGTKCERVAALLLGQSFHCYEIFLGQADETSMLLRLSSTYYQFRVGIRSRKHVNGPRLDEAGETGTLHTLFPSSTVPSPVCFRMLQPASKTGNNAYSTRIRMGLRWNIGSQESLGSSTQGIAFNGGSRKQRLRPAPASKGLQRMGRLAFSCRRC